MSNIIFKEIMDECRKGIEDRTHLPELLAPAGNMEKFMAALEYGADAVYLSGKNFGLRARARNFTVEEIEEACRYAHSRNRRVYVTVNVFPRGNDLENLPAYLKTLEEIKVDALIVSDPGVIILARRYAPGVALHLSTQANTTNYLSVRFWKDHGITRVNLARELSWEEIRHIREKTSIEIELFVHGSMCMAYSGRCVLSSFLTGRSANLGDCAQPCRWSYALVEEKRPGQYFPVITDDRGTYILSSKDLCLLPCMKELLDAGIDAFKLEGRMRGVLAVATMVRIYRAAIDSYLSDPENFSVNPLWMEELKKISHREYFPGPFFKRDVDEDCNTFTSLSYIRPFTLAGIVKRVISRSGPEGTTAMIEVRNRIRAGTTLEFLGQKDSIYKWKADQFVTENETVRDTVNPGQLIRVTVPFPLFEHQVIRKKTDSFNRS